MEIATPVPAATLMLLRMHQGEIQVFMQQRSYEASFVGGAFVFPGGKVDKQDYDFPDEYLCLPEGKIAEVLFQKPESKLACIAAIRECFEEAGILLAYENKTHLLKIDTPEKEAYWLKQRKALNANEVSLKEICVNNNLQLAINQLVFFGHWVTPKTSPQRFDTLFFACKAPEYQEGDHDDYESIHSVWWNAEQALNEYHNKKIQLIMPTLKSLEHLHNFNSIEQFMEHHERGLSVLGRDYVL